MMSEIWRVNEDLHFEVSGNTVSLNSKYDASVIIASEEIEGCLDALTRIESYFQSKVLAAIEGEKLSQWGCQKTPTEKRKNKAYARKD